LINPGDPLEVEKILNLAVKVYRKNVENIYSSREKDFSHPFRKITCDTEEEFIAVFGKIEDNSFVNESKQNLLLFEKEIQALKSEIEKTKVLNRG